MPIPPMSMPPIDIAVELAELAAAAAVAVEPMSMIMKTAVVG